MNESNISLELENEWLQKVLKEIRKKIDEKHDLKEKFRNDTINTQRELWQEIGSVSISNGLEQIVDFMQFINTMKMEKRNHQFINKLEEKYKTMLLVPYFGRIDFLENGYKEVEKCYIGISNLIDSSYDILVYDWRAPISSMFYDYEIGEASYQSPEGIVDGKLMLKRQYKINNEKIQYMFDSNLKIDDEVLQDILSKSADSKMKAIVMTIQRDQNKIIRNEEYKNLIVQGPAGSGKTSVALHRIAYLLYKHKDKIKPENIVIFSPNDIFNDYISSVLPQLGEENMYQTTFKEYMHRALGNNLIKENYCQMMEYILGSKKRDFYEKRMLNIKFKASIEFIEILKLYVSNLENMGIRFEDVAFRGEVIISSEDIQELFFKDYVKLPLKSRLKKIRERILSFVESRKKMRIKEVCKEITDSDSYADEAEIIKKSILIVKEEMKDIYYQINEMTEIDLIDIYKNLFENLEFFNVEANTKYNEIEIDRIKSYTLENIKARRLNYEDQPPILYLKGAIGDIPETSQIKYVIIDEAQDYTPLQYEVFNQLFNSASITILGDLQQSINPFMNVGDYSNITNIFPKYNTRIINLTKSYRSTMEITKFSRKLLNNKIYDEYVERSGEEPLILSFKDEEAIKERLIDDIKDYQKRYKSIGIITRTVDETKEVYNFLKDKVQVKALMKDDDEYVGGILAIPAYLSKGLEFDVVLIYNAGDGNYSCDEERLLLYTACTRALHVLRIYYHGEITPLLKKS